MDRVIHQWAVCQLHKPNIHVLRDPKGKKGEESKICGEIMSENFQN